MFKIYKYLQKKMHKNESKSFELIFVYTFNFIFFTFLYLIWPIKLFIYLLILFIILLIVTISTLPKKSLFIKGYLYKQLTRFLHSNPDYSDFGPASAFFIITGGLLILSVLYWIWPINLFLYLLILDIIILLLWFFTLPRFLKDLRKSKINKKTGFIYEDFIIQEIL
jgi:hypothetical protein